MYDFAYWLGFGKVNLCCYYYRNGCAFSFPNGTFFLVGRFLGVGGKFGVFFFFEWVINLVKGVLGVWTLEWL